MSEPPSPGNTLLVRMTGIGKRFGPVRVLDDAKMDIHSGEVHILAGENGAGKTTFIKILAGAYRDYDGTIEIGGRPVRCNSPQDATAMGVAVIHQELSLVPSMSVADNIFLGQPLTRAGLVDDSAQRAEARRLLQQLGAAVDVDRPVEQLPIAVQQLVEIAKAMSRDAKVIVMDEPTSALSAPEAEKLFVLIGELKARGCGIVYITHKLEEIERLADRVSVLRDGRLVGSGSADEVDTPKLIRWMVGREMDRQFPRHAPHLGEERLRVEEFSVLAPGRGGKRLVAGVSFSVRAGEILGIGGLRGSGASELLMGLFGAYGGRTRGRVLLDGTPVRITSPRHAIRRGVALLTNDRKATGLVLSMSIIANATLAGLTELSPGGWRRPARERRATVALARSLQLRAATIDMDAVELSGGNQQRLAIAKWLQVRPRLLLLDQPTRGIDIGAKRDVYRLMNRWTAEGIAIVLITSEMPELVAMSDRVIVMHRGRLTAELTREQTSPDVILEAAMGGKTEVTTT